MNKQKIAFILPAINIKAPIKIALSLAQYATMHFDVAIYYLSIKKSDTNIIEKLHNNNIKITKLTLYSIFEISSYDIIHSHCFLPDIINGLLVRNGHKISTIHCDIKNDMKSSYGPILGSILSSIWIFSLKKINNHIYLNNFILNKYRSNNINCKVIHNGINLVERKLPSDIKERLHGFSKNRVMVGSLGVLREIKGFTTILQAAKIDKGNNCYIIVGSGPDKNVYEKYIIDNKLEEKILLLGEIENAYMLLKEFDIIVLSSKSEGFPLVAIEALWSGKKIICTDIPSYQEVFKYADVNYFPVNDHISLNKEINNKENKNKNKNIRLYNKKMTATSMYYNYKKVYEKK
ncbi:glycosyltransferase [Morganella morganii subsp. morganii]|uniref:glycosyltransferase n=1 Tax=Morganella morganii TaxID=582 RepID=UPI001BDA2B5E|nr:glycosyltransferase [Morganella morganii]MBT0346288.1 glycosyltransferase [Morganella morganii subsp. morganii]